MFEFIFIVSIICFFILIFGLKAVIGFCGINVNSFPNNKFFSLFFRLSKFIPLNIIFPVTANCFSSYKPNSIFDRVVFPLPLSPIIPKTFPNFKLKEIFFNIVFSFFTVKLVTLNISISPPYYDSKYSFKPSLNKLNPVVVNKIQSPGNIIRPGDE